jgi:hypothetical protein
MLLCLLASQMGYGQQRTGPIPANSWLEFDVSAQHAVLALHVLALHVLACLPACHFC